MTAGTLPRAARQNRPLHGIACMSAAIVIMTSMDAFGRLLVLAGFSVFQVLALRSLIILALFAAALPWLGGLAALKSSRPGAHLLRAVFGAGAPLFFFASLRHLPLADATAVFFGATFLITALSVPVLKERVGPHRWASVVVGFIGVVIVTRPGQGFEPAALLAFGASVCYAFMVVIGRWMGDTEPVFRQVFYFNLGLAVASLPFLPFVWLPMTDDHLLMLAAMTALSIVGQFVITRAFVVAPLGVVAPFEYTALAWAPVLGYLVWGDVPDAWVVSGSLIIVASGLYLLHREAMTGRRTTAAVRDIP